MKRLVLLAVVVSASITGTASAQMVGGSFQRSVVSWYVDGGLAHCCGYNAYYGVADCGSGGGPCYAQGTRIEFCERRCVIARVDDHGPYVPGRAFDLGAATAQAIGFTCGVCSVRWRLVHKRRLPRDGRLVPTGTEGSLAHESAR